MGEPEGPWAGRDEDLAEYRRIEIGTALVAGIAVFAVPTLGLGVLLALTGLSGPRWSLGFGITCYAAAVTAVLVLVGWLVRARRREPRR